MRQMHRPQPNGNAQRGAAQGFGLNSKRDRRIRCQQKLGIVNLIASSNCRQLVCSNVVCRSLGNR